MLSQLSSSADLEQILRDAVTLLTALGLGALRPIGISLIFPVFTRAELGGILRIGFALALALPVTGHVMETLGPVGSERPLLTVFIAMKELMVGTLIGFMFGLPFWSIQAVGEIIDEQRGVTNEDAPTDPSTRSQASSLSIFLGISAIALFVAVDGLPTLAKMLYDSYGIWPLTSFLPNFSFESALAVAGSLDHIMRFALLVGGPVLALFLLLDLCVMLIGRSAPHLNDFDLPPMLKNVAFIVFMAVYVIYLIDYMKVELANIHGVGPQLERLLQ